jgi:hypothetical protein
MLGYADLRAFRQGTVKACPAEWWANTAVFSLTDYGRSSHRDEHRAAPASQFTAASAASLLLRLRLAFTSFAEYQTKLVAELRQTSAPLMCRGTCLFANQARVVRLSQKPSSGCVAGLPHHPFLCVDAVHRNTRLAIGAICIWTTFRCDLSPTITPWYCDAGNRRRLPR